VTPSTFFNTIYVWRDQYTLVKVAAPEILELPGPQPSEPEQPSNVVRLRGDE
jgi:hypothetical protein